MNGNCNLFLERVISQFLALRETLFLARRRRNARKKETKQNNKIRISATCMCVTQNVVLSLSCNVGREMSS